MKLLITGYNGFIGSNITDYFKEYQLIGMDLKPGNSVRQHIDWSNIQTIKGVNTIIHLAGMADDSRNYAHPEYYFRINLGLTKQVFDFFLQSTAQKFIFFSSVKAIADTVAGDILQEDDTPNPLTPYGQSKLAAEEYILSHTIPIGKQVYILRPCMVHGVGINGNLNLLYNLIQRRIPWPFGTYDNLRSYVSMENLMFVIQEIIERSIQDGIYQVADDEPVSSNELIKFMANSLQCKAHIWRVPKRMILSIAKVGDLLYLPLNSERLKKLTEPYVVSNIKIKKALSLEKMPITAADGFKITFEALKS